MTRAGGPRAVMALVALAAGCAYYNAMWRAEQFAKEARRLEARGRAAEARVAWAQAGTKAESVLARHPDSRWADDALVLQGEGLARSGDCAAAAGPLERARRTVTDPALFERALLAAAGCALLAGDPVEAGRLVAEVTDSRDGDRRARAAYVAGRAAWARGDGEGALDWYIRAESPEATLERALTLFRLGRAAEALEIARRVRGEPPRDGAGWADLLDEAARAAGPETASLALDRLLGGARVPAGARARLYLADGDRLAAARLSSAATARYRAAARAVPDSAAGAVAAVRSLRVRAQDARDTSELRVVLAELQRAAGGRGAAEEARALDALLRTTLGPHPHVARAFRAAELARDSLAAGPLAGRLFLDLAARHPESLFAPKALLAALALGAAPPDSILAVLRTTYAGSPYTLALSGTAGPAFGVAEDSLAHALGMGVLTHRPVARPRVAAPTPGPRGPFLDVVFRAAAGPAEREGERPAGERARVRERIK